MRYALIVSSLPRAGRLRDFAQHAVPVAGEQQRGSAAGAGPRVFGHAGGFPRDAADAGRQPQRLRGEGRSAASPYSRASVPGVTPSWLSMRRERTVARGGGLAGEEPGP